MVRCCGWALCSQPMSVSVLAVARGDGGEDVVHLAPTTGAPMGAARGGSGGVRCLEIPQEREHPYHPQHHLSQRIYMATIFDNHI
ncbi:hypothetical protein Tsubulata_031244 [Turnera subulata]|uniref:Uncharacterized protein n=1 Tax=Turnera subulata TaxID=218843 RepID=A0A9Q0GBP5_9ROSI|nr:hypothetical protein Tsubulata_031244 [Turnera subulata]